MGHRRNEEREERIAMEIIVDAYDAEERAMGWYYYLEEWVSVGFTARCQEATDLTARGRG